MDTRSKIVSRERLRTLLESGRWVVVAGLFDPLTEVQATRLAALATDGRKIAAIVLKDADCLFNDDARATLIASLRDVHAVTIAERDNWRSLAPENALVEIVDDLAAEKERSAEFVRLILDAK